MDETYTVFHGPRRLWTAPLRETLTHLVEQQGALDPRQPLLIFDDTTGRQTDFDLRGTLEDVLGRLNLPLRPPRGRPRLGVTPREITLLPRHWDWLDAQPGGASATLRRLVEDARKRGGGQVQQAQAAADRFMSALAGNLPRYLDASRALYAGDAAAFAQHIGAWPEDIRQHALHLAAPAFQQERQEQENP